MHLHPDDDSPAMRTQTGKATLNPTYQEIFTLPMDDASLSSKTLVVQAFDEDAIGRDDLIGEVLIKLSDFDFLHSSSHNAWFELKAEVRIRKHELEFFVAVQELCLKIWLVKIVSSYLSWFQRYIFAAQI